MEDVVAQREVDKKVRLAKLLEAHGTSIKHRQSPVPLHEREAAHLVMGQHHPFTRRGPVIKPEESFIVFGSEIASSEEESLRIRWKGAQRCRFRR